MAYKPDVSIWLEYDTGSQIIAAGQTGQVIFEPGTLWDPASLATEGLTAYTFLCNGMYALHSLAELSWEVPATGTVTSKLAQYGVDPDPVDVVRVAFPVSAASTLEMLVNTQFYEEADIPTFQPKLKMLIQNATDHDVTVGYAEMSLGRLS